ncbi:MAG: D-arabinono-1,4-lactone oxidase [Pirellulales bacterium]
MSESWNNWSGSVTCRPRQIAAPDSEAAVVELVRRAAEAGQCVRVAGSGHSFLPLCATDEVLVSLDALAGIESVDRDKCEATIRAGTKLHALGESLWQHGLALANQGDIDRQSLAGAIATGTHGTGRTLGSLSTQVVGLRIVTGNGDLLDVALDDDPDTMAAARVSLGALGVTTAIRMRLMPAYRLHERLWQEPIEECLARLDERIAATRHFEFFWYSATDLAHAKALDPTDREPEEMADTPGGRIDRSYRVFPTSRENRFNEMEYSVPAEEGRDCFAAIRDLMRTRHAHVTWPVEYRTLAADAIDLSTAEGRETVAISIHQAAELDHREFFADAEPIFRHHGGRPHWAKLHTLSAVELAPLYPQWGHFQAIRRKLDPRGIFMNDHLKQLFEAE